MSQQNRDFSQAQQDVAAGRVSFLFQTSDTFDIRECEAPPFIRIYATEEDLFNDYKYYHDLIQKTFTVLTMNTRPSYTTEGAMLSWTSSFFNPDVSGRNVAGYLFIYHYKKGVISINVSTSHEFFDYTYYINDK